MVIPSRWMAGGKGLDEFRERMLADKRMRSIVDYPKLYEGFPGVEIRGGISLLPLGPRAQRAVRGARRSRDGQPTGPPSRATSMTYDVFVRRNEAVPILEKV